MIRTIAAITAAGFALSACAVLPDREGPGEVTSPEVDVSEVDEDGPDARDCPAEQYQVLVGQPREEIHVSSLPRPHRIYGEGDMVTCGMVSSTFTSKIGRSTKRKPPDDLEPIRVLKSLSACLVALSTAR